MYGFAFDVYLFDDRTCVNEIEISSERKGAKILKNAPIDLETLILMELFSLFRWYKRHVHILTNTLCKSCFEKEEKLS